MMWKPLITLVLAAVNVAVANAGCDTFCAGEFITDVAGLPYEKCKEKVDSLYMAELDASVLKSVSREAENRWGDPESSSYDESRLEIFYEAESQAPCLADWERERASILLARLRRNAPGTQANDFQFTLPDGTETTLYEQLSSTDRNTLLIFYDPECDDCKVAKMYITESGEYQMFNVIAIYDGGEEDLFRESLPEMPQEWVVGDSHALVEASEIFDFITMPTIYLLAPDGKVLVKNLKIRETANADK